MKLLYDITAVNSQTATSEATGYDIDNAVDSTNFKQWRSTSKVQQTIVLNFTGTIDSIAIIGANFSAITIGGVAKTLIKDDLIGDYRGFFSTAATSSLTLIVTAQTSSYTYFKISAIVIGAETALENVIYPFGMQLVNPSYKTTTDAGYPAKVAKGENYRLIEIKRDNLDYADITAFAEIKQEIKHGQTFVLFADDSNVGECYLGTRAEALEYTELADDYGQDSLILEETGGKPYNLRTLVEISLTASTLYYALESLRFPVSSPVQYTRRLLSAGTIKDALQDNYSQFQSLSTTTITLDNLDNAIKVIHDAENLRGKTVVIKKVDLDTDTVLKSVSFTVEGASFTQEKATFSLERSELDIWHVNHPKSKFNLTDHPDIPDGANILGKGVPKYYGEVKNVPCFYTQADLINDKYYYEIQGSVSESIDNVYRDGILVDVGEYTKYLDSSGITEIVFDLEQKNFQGGLYTITADIKGQKPSGTYSENPVTCFKHWLENDVGVTCNATTFTAAETVASSLNLKVGGGFLNETEAIDLREQWKLTCRGAEFTKGASGWEIVIPVYESSTDVDLTDSNFSYSGEGESKASSFVNNITVSYYYDYAGNSYLKTSEATCAKAYGTDKEYKLQLVNDDETASRICQYIRNNFLYGDETLEGETGRDGATLIEGKIVGLTTIKPALSDARYRIKTITRNKSNIKLLLSTYSNSIFSWSSTGYQPSPPTGDARSLPDNVTSLVVTGVKTIQPDGTVGSYFTVTFTAPTSNFTYARMELKVDGGVYSEIGTCADGTFFVPGLTPGLEYYVRATSVNGGHEATGTESAKTLALGDTTAPGIPANFAASNIINGVRLTWDNVSDKDVSYYEIFRNSATLNKIKTNSYDDLTEAFTTEYTYKVRAVDNTGNEGTFTADDTGTAQKATESQITLDYSTSSIRDAANNAQTTADGKIVSFYQDEPPTAGESSEGDIWFDTNDGNKIYTYLTDTWTATPDSDLALALSNAATAQATADGKIVTFYEDEPPTAEGTGDLWVDTNDDNKLYRWSGAAWVDVRDGLVTTNAAEIVLSNTAIGLRVTQTDYESLTDVTADTVAGKVNTSTINITPTSISLQTGGTIDIGAGRSINIASETGSFNVTAGSINISADGVIDISTASGLIISATLGMSVTGSMAVSGTVDVFGDLNVTTWDGDVGAINVSTGAINITSTGSININSADAELNVTAGAINITSSGAINIDTEAGLVVSAASGMTVTGGIDVTTGEITLGESGDLIFTGCCKMDADSTEMRFAPTSGNKELYIGASASAYHWNYIRGYSNNLITWDAGTDLQLSATDDVHIFAGDSVWFRNGRLGFFNGSQAAKQTITITAVGGAPFLYNQVWGNTVEASLASIKASLVAYSLVA